MKKVIILAVALTLVTAGIALAGVTGSKHDMTLNSGVNATETTSQICVFCHHPHRGSAAGVQNDLLWNISDITASYTMYAKTDTMNDNYTQSDITVSTGKPQTLLCMGCHDGSTADNTWVTGSNDLGLGGGNTTNLALGAAANLEETLEEDHPVGFSYPTASVGGFGDLTAPDTVNDEVVGGLSSNTYPLFGGQMECATCHDVHAGTTSVSADIQFMRGDIAGSQICIDCHSSK